MTRKEMIIKSAVAAGSLAVMGIGCATPKQSKDELSEMFVHHVLFWLKEPENVDARCEFEAGVRELLKIDLIVMHNFGVPATTNRDVIENSYTYSMVACFKNKADQDIYQTHPDHLKFIEKCSHLWQRVMVIDTEAI